MGEGVSGYLHAIGMELMATGKTHDLANTIHILFKTDNTFLLPTTVAAPPLG